MTGKEWAHEPEDRELDTWRVVNRRTGEVVVTESSYQVTNNIAYALNTGAGGCSEADEVARAILSKNKEQSQ